VLLAMLVVLSGVVAPRGPAAALDSNISRSGTVRCFSRPSTGSRPRPI